MISQKSGSLSKVFIRTLKQQISGHVSKIIKDNIDRPALADIQIPTYTEQAMSPSKIYCLNEKTDTRINFEPLNIVEKTRDYSIVRCLILNVCPDLKIGTKIFCLSRNQNLIGFKDQLGNKYSLEKIIQKNDHFLKNADKLNEFDHSIVNSLLQKDNAYIKRNSIIKARKINLEKKYNDLYYTGIKAVDLLAPYTHGSNVGIVGHKFCGKKKFITHLLKNFDSFYSGYSIVSGIKDNPDSRYSELKNAGIMDRKRSTLIYTQNSNLLGLRYSMIYKAIMCGKYWLYRDSNKENIEAKNSLIAFEDVDEIANSADELNRLIGRKVINKIQPLNNESFIELLGTNTPSYLNIMKELFFIDCDDLPTTSTPTFLTLLQTLNINQKELHNPSRSPTLLLPYFDTITVFKPPKPKHCNIKISEERLYDKTALNSLIDPLKSASRVMNNAIQTNNRDNILTNEHIEIANQVRSILQRKELLDYLQNQTFYQKIYKSYYIKDHLSKNQLDKNHIQLYSRATKLENYLLTQPSNSFVSIENIIRDCKKIISGSLDHVDESKLKNIEILDNKV